MRILVVDCEPTLHELCMRASAQSAHEVVAAASIAKGLAAAASAPFDLVIVGPGIAIPSASRAAALDNLASSRRRILYVLARADAASSLPELEWKLMADFAVWPLSASELKVRMDLFERKLAADRGAEAVLAAIPDLMFRQTRDGTYIDYHGPRDRMLTAPESFMGKRSDEVLPPALAAQVSNSIALALDSGAPVQFEYDVEIPDTDETSRFEARLVPSGPNEVLSIIRDLTALRRAGRALAESQETVRALLAGIPDSVFRIHRNGTFLDYIPKNTLPAGIHIDTSLVGSSRDQVMAAVPAIPRQLAEVIDGAACRAIDNGTVEAFDYSLGEGAERRQYEVRMVCCGEDQALGIIRDVTENRRAEEDLRAAAHAKQAFASRILKLQESERQHIARELHDAVGQMLLVHKLDAEWIRARASCATARDAAEAMCASIDETLKMVRALASGLRPPALDDLGIGPALESLIEDMCRRAGIRCEHNIGELAADLPAEIGTTLYRIAQEALANAIRHGGPSAVWLNLYADADRIVMVIEDNGVGIDPKVARDAASLGLVGMTERAELLDGRVAITNRAPGGTAVRVELPGMLHSGQRS